jgi:hypothetical protein
MVAPGRVELPTFGLGNRCSIHLSYGAVCLFASVYTLRRVLWLYKGCTCVESQTQLQHRIMHFFIANTDVAPLRRAHVAVPKDTLDHDVVDAQCLQITRQSTTVSLSAVPW